MEIRANPLQRSRTLIKELNNKYYNNLKHVKEVDQKVVYHSGEVPTEFLAAMDFALYCPEPHAALCAARGLGVELCEIAETHDYSPDICSYARSELGACFSNYEKSPIGALPKPDLLYTTSDCEAHIGWFRALSRFYGVPLLVLDTPTVHDGLDAQEIRATTQYVAGQLAEHITWLEQFTRRRCDWDRLSELVKTSGRTARLFGEIRDMAKRKPAPISLGDLCTLSGPLMYCRHSGEGLAAFEEAKAEVQERLDRGEGSLSEERYRLYFDQIPMWPKWGYFLRRFASQGANILISYFGYALTDKFAPLDGARPLESMAEGQVTHMYNMGTAHRIEKLASIIEDYSVDGLVMQLSRSCGVYAADQRALAKELPYRTGRPRMVIEGDMCDHRMFSETEWEPQIDSFLEVLEQRARRC